MWRGCGTGCGAGGAGVVVLTRPLFLLHTHARTCASRMTSSPVCVSALCTATSTQPSPSRLSAPGRGTNIGSPGKRRGPANLGAAGRKAAQAAVGFRLQRRGREHAVRHKQHCCHVHDACNLFPPPSVL